MSEFGGFTAASREEKEFRIILTHRDAMVVRLRFKREDGKKRLRDFAVIYDAEIRGSWHEVIRYDTAHGYPEVHKLRESPIMISLSNTEMTSGITTGDTES